MQTGTIIDLRYTQNSETSLYSANPCRSDHLTGSGPASELRLFPYISPGKRILSCTGSYTYSSEIAFAVDGCAVVICDPTQNITEGQVHSYTNFERGIEFHYFGEQRQTMNHRGKKVDVTIKPAQFANNQRRESISSMQNITLRVDLPDPGTEFDIIYDYWGLAGQLTATDYVSYIYYTTQLLSIGGRFHLAPIGRMSPELQQDLRERGYSVKVHTSNNVNTSYVEIVRNQ